MGASVQAVDVRAHVTAGRIIAVTGVVDEVRLGGADEVAQLIVTACVNNVAVRTEGGATYAMGILRGKKDLDGSTNVSVSRLLVKSASAERRHMFMFTYKKSSTAMLQAQVEGGYMRTREAGRGFATNRDDVSRGQAAVIQERCRWCTGNAAVSGRVDVVDGGEATCSLGVNGMNECCVAQFTGTSSIDARTVAARSFPHSAPTERSTREPQHGATSVHV